MYRDERGDAVSAAGREAVDAFDAVIRDFLGFGRNAGALLKTAFEADPDMPMAHCLRGYFFHLMGNGALAGRARRSHESAVAAAERGNDRERRHAAALGAWCDGDVTRALALWEDILLDHPRDVLALKLAHFQHFYRGETDEHRDSVARVMPAWDESVPGYGYVLGMRAFGLEEAGAYGEAEETGRRAVEIDHTDTWAIHAVAHVLEMQGRHEEGIAWIDRHSVEWQDKVHNFANHVWWHQALYHLERGRHDAVLGLYDGRFRADRDSDDYLDMSNAVAMLCRLEMRGLDVGGRWAELAAKAAGRTDEHIFPFIDAHFVMALAMHGERETVEAMIASMRAWASAHPEASVAPVYREVGIPLAEAIAAYAVGDYGTTVDRLMPVRYGVQRIGGSHAQRDLFALLLDEAALRGGRFREARALAAERVALKPLSAHAWTLFARALDGIGDRPAAARARDRAQTLLAA